MLVKTLQGAVLLVTYFLKLHLYQKVGGLQSEDFETFSNNVDYTSIMRSDDQAIYYTKMIICNLFLWKKWKPPFKFNNVMVCISFHFRFLIFPISSFYQSEEPCNKDLGALKHRGEIIKAFALLGCGRLADFGLAHLLTMC